MKIIAFHENYPTVAQQCSGNVHLMADSSLAKSGKPWFLPEYADEFVYHTHIVFRVGRLGKNIAARFAHRYVDAVTVGATVEAPALGNGALANAFDGAAMIGDFVPIQDLQLITASLTNGSVTTTYSADEMLWKIDQLIEYISRYFTLKIGDIIYSGWGDSPTPLAISQHFIGTINNQEVLNIKIK
ncbi:MAG: fumarylacetoacetate hydrolase family protein [Muribaculaceae bacterium]